MKRTLQIILTLGALMAAGLANAQSIDAALQAKLDIKTKEIQSWAADSAIVSAVKSQNGTLPAPHGEMTQDKWKAATVLDPFVRSFTKNPAGEFLKGKKGADVAEAFVSDANGLKVAFLSKTSNWSHKGKPKHDVPMSGKVWQGAIETDESTGLQQIQVAVPVLDGDKPIGVLTAGLSIRALTQ